MARRWALLAQKDARLAALIDGWERLPEPLKTAVAGLVAASAKTAKVL